MYLQANNTNRRRGVIVNQTQIQLAHDALFPKMTEESSASEVSSH